MRYNPQPGRAVGFHSRGNSTLIPEDKAQRMPGYVQGGQEREGRRNALNKTEHPTYITVLSHIIALDFMTVLT